MGSCLVSTASEFVEAAATFLQASTTSDSFLRFMGATAVVALPEVTAEVAAFAVIRRLVVEQMREKEFLVDACFGKRGGGMGFQNMPHVRFLLSIRRK